MIWDESLLPKSYYIAVFTDGYAVARESAWGECQLFTSVYHRKEMAISDFVLNQVDNLNLNWFGWVSYALIDGKVVNAPGYYNRRLRDAVFRPFEGFNNMLKEVMNDG